MGVRVVAAVNNVVLEILGREAYWIAFVQFLLMRPVIHILPTIRLGNELLNLVLGAMISMTAMSALLAIPLLVFGCIPMPRDPEFRQAYFWGLISGGLLTHVLWLSLIKASILSEHGQGSE